MPRLPVATTLLLCITAAEARQDQLGCGTHPTKWLEELHLHRRAERGAKLRSTAAISRNLLPDIGDIAVIDDADGVIARRNMFNLQRRTIRFTPSGPGYRFEVIDEGYDENAAAAGELVERIGDDDTRQAPIPFPFPFYGQTWDAVFINSDGNLSFGAGDSAISERSLGRVTAGPPRIAGLYRDLDPTRARDGIRVHSTEDRFVVSWVEVPEFQEFGTGPLQSFQIALHRDGVIEMAYLRVTTQDAVTGVAPGRLLGPAAVVSFAGGSSQVFTGSVLERFAGSEEVDIFAASQKFFVSHEDSYDYLVIFNTLGIPAGSGTVAFQSPVRNNRSGYGDPKIDVGLEAGSWRRLQTILNMGPLSQYPVDPNEPVPQRAVSGDTPLTILAHEAGHLFLAYASVRSPNDIDARPMLGRENFHWAFTYNSDASLLEGNRIQDNGPEASPRFTTTATVQHYSAMDLYLMGLLPPEEVPDSFVVERATVSASRAPQKSVSFNGTRRDVSVGEIIEAEGPRIPAHTVAQRRFRFAFVLITRAGETPSAAHIAQVDRYRREFETFFSQATNGRAIADTRLGHTLYVSVFPAAGVIEGRSARVEITTDRLVDSPLTVTVRSRGVAADATQSVTIPRNGGAAEFELRGIREGVQELVFEPSDSRWETVEARVQVSRPQNLALQVTQGAGEVQPGIPVEVEVRLTDENDLPYPGVPLSVAATSGRATGATTDVLGFARIVWTPGDGSDPKLMVSVENGPSVTVESSKL